MSGIKIWIYLETLFWEVLQNKDSCLLYPLWCKYSKPNSWCHFSQDDILLALVIANVALHWTESLLLERDWFKGWL